MQRLGDGRTKVERLAARRRHEALRAIGVDFERARLDAGMSLEEVAQAARVSRSHIWRIEHAAGQASLESMGRVAAALGGRMSVRFYPETGPTIRDRHQAAMAEALLAALDRGRWRAHLEVVVSRPVHGVIDVVLVDGDHAAMVATEIQSDLRRIEQELRWANEKSGALQSTELFAMTDAALGRRPAVDRLLVLRSTERTRRLAREFATLMEAAYPARATHAIAALTTREARWPGSAIVWMNVDRGRASLLPGPPRGVSLGR